MHLRRAAIYRHRWHLVVTFGIVIVPFAYLLVFSRLTARTSGTFALDVGTSALRLIVAYAIAAAFGWLAAVACGRGRTASVALPLFDVLQSFPTFALVPIATLAWGPSNATVIALLVVTIIWPILFSTLTAVRMGKHDWQEAVQIAGLRKWNYVRLYLWPISLPGLITGSIIGIGEGWEALVATEMLVGSRAGLGEFFRTFVTNPTITAFGILGFLLLIFGVNKLVWLPLLEWSHREMTE